MFETLGIIAEKDMQEAALADFESSGLITPGRGIRSIKQWLKLVVETIEKTEFTVLHEAYRGSTTGRTFSSGVHTDPPGTGLKYLLTVSSSPYASTMYFPNWGSILEDVNRTENMFKRGPGRVWVPRETNEFSTNVLHYEQGVNGEVSRAATETAAHASAPLYSPHIKIVFAALQSAN